MLSFLVYFYGEQNKSRWEAKKFKKGINIFSKKVILRGGAQCCQGGGPPKQKPSYAPEQDTIHMATIPWTINNTKLGAISLLSVSIRTLAINWSISQLGHNPHGYNPVNYQRHYIGRDLVCYVNRTIAIDWSISQTGHDPHCYNPGNYQRHYTGRDLVC